jgi:hypothetical protein
MNPPRSEKAGHRTSPGTDTHLGLDGRSGKKWRQRGPGYQSCAGTRTVQTCPGAKGMAVPVAVV